MNAIDTNILVYRLDRSDAGKQATARQLIRDLGHQRETVLPWQVVAEFLRQLSSWRDQGRLTHEQVVRFFLALRGTFPIVTPTEAICERALELAEGHSLSHWDSMIVAACIEARVDTLYTEDMGAPRQLGPLQLVNPF
jgi:predicted nucleic acid-binding protein